MNRVKILIYFCLFFLGLIVYHYFKLPEGVVAQSSSVSTSQELISWLGLATSIISFLTAIVSLVASFVKDRKEKQRRE